MNRVDSVELLDADGVCDEVVARSYRELWLLHFWLGNTAAVLRRLRRGMDGRGYSPVRLGADKPLVLDIGCAQGALLKEIQRRLAWDVVGMDLRPAPLGSTVPILTGDAVNDPLPGADVAVSVVMAHHLSPEQVRGLVRNVGRSCRRFILLDLVRHPLPLWLFRLFLAPLLSPINAADGITSIQRAYTASELRELVDAALQELGRPVPRLEHTVGPLWMRQIVDITWD